jgi:ATP-binding cassette subfamily C protein
VSARFTTLVVLTGVLTFVLMRGFLRRSVRLGDRYVGSFNRLLKYIDDFWVTVKIAKVHNSERFYYDKFDNANQDILKLQYRLTRNYALPQLLYKLAGIVVLVAVIYLGYRVEQVPLASFFILIVLFARIFPQFAGINSELSYIFSDIASVKMVLKLDETFEERGFPEVKHGDALQVKKDIRIEDLHFAYPNAEPLFTGFSASIQANRLTGIVGESGRGKTTLIDLIAGLQKPQAGHIMVDGKTLDDSLLPAWKSSIGYLPQDSFFVDGSIRENLVWDSGKNFSDYEIMQVLKQVNIDELINRQPKGLDTELANYAYYFSGGERQRLALARVLLRKPRLLILDEATSSLDAENEKRIMEVIEKLKKHITILFITHRESVFPWFDQMIRL